CTPECLDEFFGKRARRELVARSHRLSTRLRIWQPRQTDHVGLDQTLKTLRVLGIGLISAANRMLRGASILETGRKFQILDDGHDSRRHRGVGRPYKLLGEGSRRERLRQRLSRKAQNQ